MVHTVATTRTSRRVRVVEYTSATTRTNLALPRNLIKLEIYAKINRVTCVTCVRIRFLLAKRMPYIGTDAKLV